jgi:hypothetical protein
MRDLATPRGNVSTTADGRVTRSSARLQHAAAL